MSTQKELRKSLELGVKAALEQRSFRRKGRTTRYVSRDMVEPPLEAELLVGVDSDRYGAVRIMGSADIVVPEVEEFLAGAVPPSALSEVDELYYGRAPFYVAMEIFAKIDGVPRNAPLEWRAHSPEDALATLEEFTGFIDGPVRRWIDDHSSISAIRAAPAAGGPGAHGSIVRGVAALEVILGDVDAAVARLLAYRNQPSRSDSPERIQAFITWLKQAAAERRSADSS